MSYRPAIVFREASRMKPGDRIRVDAMLERVDNLSQKTTHQVARLPPHLLAMLQDRESPA